MKTRLFRVVLLLIGASLLLTSADADAEPTPGLTATVYNNYGYNNAPPLPDDSRFVGVTVFSGINQNFDIQPVFGMYEDFAVKYEGFITLPCTCTVQLLALADDGTILYLDDQEITYDWWDKGSGGTVSEPIQFQESLSKKITLWFYENGGGAWVQLLWNLNEQWEIVPDTAFTQVAVTTTVPTTTTSEPPTTTTQAPTTTTTTSVPVVSTTVEQTTTSIQTTTSTAVPSTTSTTTSTPPLPTQPLSNPISTSTSTVPEPTAQIQALATATNSEALAELSTDEATELFATLEVSELSEEQAAALVEAVQTAPQEVREAFEAEVNIFNGAVDTYVPVGSTIPVSQRRALIVVTVTAMAASILTSRKW